MLSREKADIKKRKVLTNSRHTQK